MAVKKKALAKEEVEEVQVKAVPQKTEARRLDQAEMRRLERISGEISQSRTRMHLQEQVLANLNLKMENMKLMFKDLEREALLVKERVKSENDEMAAKAKSLESFASELKNKYGLAGEELRYDMLTGQIQK